jgi:hypothetical protein
MVENSGKTLRTNTIKLNEPEQIGIQESASGLPIAVRAPGQQSIATIEDRWRIDDEWWRSEPVSRLYYAIITASGQRIVIYKDLVDKRWYRQ